MVNVGEMSHIIPISIFSHTDLRIYWFNGPPIYQNVKYDDHVKVSVSVSDFSYNFYNYIANPNIYAHLKLQQSTIHWK